MVLRGLLFCSQDLCLVSNFWEVMLPFFLLDFAFNKAILRRNDVARFVYSSVEFCKHVLRKNESDMFFYPWDLYFASNFWEVMTLFCYSLCEISVKQINHRAVIIMVWPIPPSVRFAFSQQYLRRKDFAYHVYIWIILLLYFILVVNLSCIFWFVVSHLN